MTDRERVQLRGEILDRLLQIYRIVRPDMSFDLVDAALRADPSDEAEEGALDELRALDAQLDERERHQAHALEDAMRRIGSDRFGVCIDCDQPIPFARLRAVPFTLRCAEDEARVEPPLHHSTL